MPVRAGVRRDVRVLLTDGETRSVVAAARGLADAGYQVVVTASRPGLAPAHWSRAVDRRLATPDALTQPEAFVEALEGIAAGGGFAVLLPGSDASLIDVSRARDRLAAHVRLGLPPAERVEAALDKAQLAATATRHELAPPRTVVCHDHAQAAAAAGQIGYPVLVKPLRSVIEGPPGRRHSGSLLADDEGELAPIFTHLGTALVQERVGGALISFAGVFAGGRLLAEAVSRYHRTWYPQAGAVSFSHTIAPPDALRERVLALVADLGWEGLFELELIEAGGHRWHAIDFNPRPYGSMALAIAAGANLPAVWCRYLEGAEPAPEQAVPGVFYRWTDADLRHGLWQLRHGNPGAAAAVLRAHRGVVHPYGRRDDPGPTLGRGLELASGALARRRRAGPPGRPSRPSRPGRPSRPSRLGRTGRPGQSNGRGPVVVIGAGPNGLAVTAHLRAAGLEARCLGEPLESWTRHMPAGMMLRSQIRSSHIADPHRELTIEAYERAVTRRLPRPNLPLQDFVDYGRWFQRHAVPDLDRRRVAEVSRATGGFSVRLADGEELPAARVVVAAGLAPFMTYPAPFAGLSSAACSHAYEHRRLDGFAGRAVAVIGAGQSALEYAALLHESGARVEVLARTQAIHWLSAPEPTAGNGAAAGAHPRFGLEPPPTDVGGRLTGWIAAVPGAFRAVPKRLAPEISYRCIRPAGAHWLRSRLTGVTLTCGREVVRAEEGDGRVALHLSDGSQRTVDHVLLGTGYTVDVRRYPFLAPELAAELSLADGYPVLGPGLESSVAGLHFMGAPAAHSFGPIMRFVVGTWYSAPAVARRAAGHRQPPLSVAF